MTFETAFRWGREGEMLVVSWLKSRGFFVTPRSFASDADALRIANEYRSMARPDLLAARGFTSRWVEVKTKDHAHKFIKLNRWVHGIDLPLWDAYLEVERQTGLPGYLAIVEHQQRRLLFGSFRSIGVTAQVNRGGSQFPRGAVNFDINRFEEWHDLSNLLRDRRPSPLNHNFVFGLDRARSPAAKQGIMF